MAAPTFDAATRARYPALVELFDDLERFTTGEYSARFVDRHVLSRGGLLSGHLLSVLPRARSLGLSAIVETNAGFAPGLFVVVRAHFEAAGELAYLVQESSRGKLNPVTFRQVTHAIHKDMSRHLSEETIRAFGVVNAKDLSPKSTVNYIEAVDALGGYAGKQGPFYDRYAWLSEFTHPNALSRKFHSEFSAESDGRPALVFQLDPPIAADDLERVLLSLRASHKVFLGHFDTLMAAEKMLIEKAGGEGEEFQPREAP